MFAAEPSAPVALTKVFAVVVRALSSVTVPDGALGALRDMGPAVLLPVFPEGGLVKFHVQVSVVIDCGGGCHVVAGPAGRVRVREPAIDVLVRTSSAAGKPHS